MAPALRTLMLTPNRPFGIFPDIDEARAWLDSQPVPQGTRPGGGKDTAKSSMSRRSGAMQTRSQALTCRKCGATGVLEYEQLGTFEKMRCISVSDGFILKMLRR